MVVQVAAAAVARAGTMGARVAARGGAAAAKAGVRAGARAGGRAASGAARSGARGGARAAGRGARSAVRPGGVTRPVNAGERAARRAANRHSGGRRRSSSGVRGGMGGARGQPSPEEGADKANHIDPAKAMAAGLGAAAFALRNIRHPVRGLVRAGFRARARKREGAKAQAANKKKNRFNLRLALVIGLVVFAITGTMPFAFLGPNPNSPGTSGGQGAYATITANAGIPFPELFNNTAEIGIDPRFVAAVAWQESIHFSDNVIECRLSSPAGAQGIMQFMPATAAGRNVDPCDPASAIPGGARYLKDNYDQFGSWELAAAAYNAGAGAVQQYDGIPPYRETQNYVQKVMAQWEVYKRQFPSGGVDGGGGADGEWALPLEQQWYEQHKRWFTKPHHDYAAADIPVPTGTPVYAMTSGTVQYWGGSCGNGLMIRANGVELIYCHGSEILVDDGARVSAGDPIMRSGNTGNSTGPHLHIGIEIGETRLCPQSLFVALAEGDDPPAVADLPRSGCSY